MTEQVKQVMTKRLITVSLTDSVRTAYEIMREHRIRHLPVVDESNDVIGIVSDRDLRRAMKPKKDFSILEESSIEFDPKFKVAEFMSWPVQTVSEYETVHEIADLMIKEKISAVLVIGEHDRPKGIVTSDDLLKLLVKLLEREKSDREMRLNRLFDEDFQTSYMI
jgi:acetoin utilization protein AcuB